MQRKLMCFCMCSVTKQRYFFGGRFGSFVILLNVLLDQNYVVKSWQSSKSASRYTVDIHGTQRMNPNDCGQLLAFFWVELLG